MDRIWQWAWDRYRESYSWAAYAVMTVVILPVYLFWTFLIVAVEGARRYVEAAAVSVGAVPVLVHVILLPGLGSGRFKIQWTQLALGRKNLQVAPLFAFFDALTDPFGDDLLFARVRFLDQRD